MKVELLISSIDIESQQRKSKGIMKAKLYTLLSVLSLVAAGSLTAQETTAPSEAEVVEHYAKIVHANYSDCLKTAQELQQKISSLIENPTVETLSEAKEAWLLARKPYGQSEVFRFYGGPIDDEEGPEGLLNAWPLDETYIESDGAIKGIINDTKKFPEISTELLISLNEKEGEENISTGYHAIEFLLWGVDKSKTGPGERPVSDYTTAPGSDRRKQYLTVVTDQLIADLTFLEKQWSPGQKNYRSKFVAMDSKKSLQHILNGVGMLSGFELARERVDVPLSSMSQEDEHSCFSDNTHNDIIYNAMAVQNVFEGQYDGVYFDVKPGASVRSLFENGKELSASISKSVKLAKGLKAPFDQLIIESNKEGRASVKALVESLSDQATKVSQASSAIGIEINIEE